MKWWPFQNKRGRRPRQNTRFRERRPASRDSKLAVQVPRSRREMRQVRQARLRLFCIIGGVAVALVAAGLWVHSQWQRVFHANPDFAVGDFEFKTNGGITRKQAASTAGLRSDMNLMDADIAGIREKLMALPRVKSVAVERRLPGRLYIEVEERLPVAWLTSRAYNMGRDKRVFIDSTGVAFKCEEFLRQYTVLPVIDDSSLAVINFGQRVESPAALAALEVLEKLRTRRLPVPCSVSTIYAPNAWTLNVETEAGALLTFHTSALEEQMDRLAFIMKQAAEYKRSIATVNLQMQRNVPVTFFNTVAATPPPPPAPVPGTAVPLEPAPRVRTQRVSAPATAPARAVPAAPSRERRDIETILRGT
jgi:cell division septal protein FtsQ